MSTTLAPAPAPLPARPADNAIPVWQAPLVPIAVASSAGIALDRACAIPPLASLAAAAACLLVFVVKRHDRRRLLPLLYLWTACAALGGTFHHAQRTAIAADDVRHLTGEEGRPARVRGRIETAPAVTPVSRSDPLRSMPRRDSMRFVLRLSAAHDPISQRWQAASGQVQVTAPVSTTTLGVGDAVEMVGRLSLPDGPANPGEFDYAGFLADRQLSALLAVRDATSIVVREQGRLRAVTSWPALVRAWGQEVLTGAVPAPHGDLAAALLLGDSPGMTTDDWDLYQRTGVIHVLAISGQHLVVLALLVWFGLQLARVRRRRGALLVAALLFAYALVAGGRPPVMRSAWMMAAYSLGIVLQRPANRANTFALAWLLVALANPADLFNAGCQLSFLAVAVLVWGAPGLASLSVLWRFHLFSSADPLQRVIDEGRPLLLQIGAGTLRRIAEFYLLNVLIWLAVTPLAAYHFHFVSPIALLLGPPLVLLTSIALIAGFGVLLLAPLAAPLAWPFALVTGGSLAACAGLTEFGARLPGAYFYVPDIPLWWLFPFYALLLLGLGLRLPADRPRLALALLLGSLSIGLLATLWPHRPGEFRCTFLAVGHGGCAVIETPGGKVLLYDVGSMAGPELARRQVAPFLWRRGIRRIDELILSHADLDHFNGIPDLLERFSVGRVTHTPTFPQRDLHAVAVALTAIEKRGVPRRVVCRGSCWSHDTLDIEVLHPPADGPEGKENVRSLVLLLRHGDVSLLLTGDLEDEGLQQLLAQPPRPVEVLMAPHHGSARSSTPQLARWASPQLVVIGQGKSDDTTLAAKAYDATRSTVLGTWPHGAIAVCQDGQRAWVETFRTGQRWPLSASVD